MQPRRQHLVDTAFRLFNENGYHATGIDLILAEAGVSKATLYKHFRSKDELILTVLEQRHQQVTTSVRRAMERAGEAGDRPALGLFDALDEWFRAGDFFGCNFINASAEYALEEHPVHAISARHKTALQQLVADNLNIRGRKKRTRLAVQLALLADGAIVRAHTLGDRDAARQAKRMAETLLAAEVAEND